MSRKGEEKGRSFGNGDRPKIPSPMFWLVTLLLAALCVSCTEAALLHTRQSSSGNVLTAGPKKCLDVVNGNIANGIKANIQQCATGKASQLWQFKAAAVSGLTMLQTPNGYCLDVPNGNAANGVVLQIWQCSSSNANQFFTRSGNNIVWNRSNYCIDVQNGVSTSFANGQPITLWTCSANNQNQVFTGPSTAAIASSSPLATPTVATTLSTTRTTTTTTSTSSTTTSPTPTAPVTAKRALTSIFIPSAKRMLAWGYDNRVAGGIGAGSKISSYHHWEYDYIPQMPAKNTFIPMYWGVSKNSSWAQVKQRLGSTIPPVVMGFNEPDISTQANMDPALAASVFYNEITIPFGRKGANVVSPAIVWNLNGWMVPFMNRCNQLGCGIDAMGQHIYTSINGNVDGAVADVKNQITNMYRAFGKPIVLSEIGLTQSGGGTDAQILDFVKKVGNYLDKTPYVLAWALSAVFARNNGWDGFINGQSAFYNVDGTLTDLAYKYMYDTF